MDIAAAIGMPPIIGVMMGVITGVFGGVLRDVLCNEVPQVSATTGPTSVRICRWLGRCGPCATCRRPTGRRWWPAWVLTAGLRGLAVWRKLGAARVAG